MLYKENKGNLDDSKFKSENGGGTARSRRMPFMDERDFRDIAAMNGAAM